MFISRKNYVKLVSGNKKLTKEVYELQDRIKCLTVTNEEHYKRAIKWKHNYDKMRELFDNREIKSPIVEQRDAEIEALKHMLERTESEYKDLKTNTRALNKENDKLVKELSSCQQELNFLRDTFKRKLEIAEIYHDVDKFEMLRAFFKEVE